MTDSGQIVKFELLTFIAVCTAWGFES